MRHRDAVSHQRILAEAQVLARLNHPNIVAVYDSGWHDGVPFIVMELVRGMTLEQWMRAHAPARWHEVRSQFVAAARGLAAAHDAGIVHRDFKPANVLLGDDGRVRVADFGIARSASAESGGATEEERPRPGTGTPGYMAPEQSRSAPPDPRMDQYAFCVSLYRALTGELPFEATTANDPVATRELPAMPRGIPKWVGQVLRRGLSSSASNRYSTMHEVIAALERLRWRRRPWSLAVGVGAVVTASAAAGAMAFEADPCASVAASTLELWPAALQSAFARSGHRDPSAVFDRVAATVDTYAAELVLGRTEACRATWVRREQSDELFDRRMRCFDQRQVALEVVVASLRESSPDALDRAPDLVAALPSLHRCSDVEALAMERDLAAASRTEVLALSQQIEQLRAQSDLGRPVADRDAQVDAILVAARELGDPYLVVDALLLAGTVHLEARRFEQAHERLEEAFWLADRSRYDELGGHAALALARVAAEQPGRLGQATLWIDHARAAYRRGGVPEGVTSSLARAASQIEADLGHHDLALRWARKSLDTAASVSSRVKAQLQVARAYEAAASFEDAQRECRAAIEMAIDAFGPVHDTVATTRFERSRMLVWQEQYEQALDELKEAARIYERLAVHPHKLLTVQASIANLLADQDRAEEALPYAREARDGFERLYGAGHPLVVAASVNLGTLLFDLRQFEASERVCATARAEHAAHALDHVPSWRAIDCEAAAMLEQGRSREAKQLLQATLKSSHLDPDSEESGLLHFGLARALHANCDDPQRVAKLIEEAAEVYRLVLGTPEGAATPPESWLASRGTRRCSNVER